MAYKLIFLFLTVLLALAVPYYFTHLTTRARIDPEIYCQVDEDCACGVHTGSGDCFYGNKNYVDVLWQCPDFCTGIGGNLVIKCVENKCSQVNIGK